MCESFVTIATDDVSSLGCLVLCNSLKQTCTDKIISVLINPSVSYHLKSVLRKSFDNVYCTNDLYVISDGRNRFDVRGDYERLKCWLLTDFTKCVFLESDVLVVENIDDLFDRLELSAVSDPRWPDCFDDGVFVFQPCLKTYKQLIEYSITNLTPDNSFKCLLNMFFCDWNIINMDRKIPFIYNCQLNNDFYTHTTALFHFGHSIKAVRMGHSISNLMQSNPHSNADTDHDNWSKLWNLWWKIFNETVKPAVNNDDTLNFKRTSCAYGDKNQDLENVTEEGGNNDPQSSSCHGHGCSPRQSTQCQGQHCSTSDSSLDCQDQDFNCSSQDARCSALTIGCPKPESICPSQDFYITEEHSLLIIQSISQEEPCQTTTDTYVESPLASSVIESVDSVDIATEELINEEVEKCHRLKWERGEIDYMGKDSFLNILLKLNSTMVSATNEQKEEIVYNFKAQIC